ncbi:HAMP domain-containing protein, partial [Geminocystis sp. CENA526]|uniref:HAMP domain-containing protein n=1 Tax=Geminocystis sp. CENA526 TaxID=1355871 RepID=UPI003D6EB366
TQAPEKPKFNTSSVSVNKAPIPVVIKPTPKKEPLPIVTWFYNISIRKKQVFVLVTAQAISIAALLGVGVIQVVQGGREQLVNQSISELEATKINYSIKVNQMGFGFRGQSDNLAIINAALTKVNGGTLSPQDRSIVRQILQNEIKARNIEYATLVGVDQRIIVNANNDRTGQEFNPNGLVSEVINNPQQIKITEIKPWADLAKELPPIFSNLSQNQDVLIRYTFTPVFRPNTQQVIGVLISGDVVDGKFSIVEDTIKEFQGGYSAIYKITGDKDFSLSSALTETETVRGQPLATQALLELALKNPDEIVSIRDKVGDTTYTLTGQILKNFQEQPVGILVRGTSEKALNQIISNSLSAQGQTAVAVLIVNLLLILVLGRVIAKPIESLQLTAEKFAEGDYSRRTTVQGDDEIGKLARTFNVLADNIEESESFLMLDASKVSLFQDITGSTTLDEDDVNKVFDRALPKAKEILQVDRLVIYRFKPDWSGYI